MYTRVKTQSEQQAIRESGRMLASALSLLKSRVEPGVSTRELAVIAAREVKALGGESPFLGYGGPTPFPDVICISVNNQVVHGIPGNYEVKNGDIVSLDFGVKYRGMITDSALSVIAGTALDSRHQDLVDSTEKAMLAGVAAVHGGVRTGDIGAAVEVILKRKHYGIVRDLVGHGVGHELHEDPNIPNYGRSGSGPELHAGMTIAIEPMATLGGGGVYVDRDGWTIMTRDGSWAAHFEHTVLITEDGAEILTARTDKN